MKTEELIVKYTSTLWRAEDESCVIARGHTQQSSPVTLKGHPEAGPRLIAGATYRFHGTWQEHEKHGKQFAFVSFSPCVPADRQGVIAYLISVADNVGEKRANALWDRYGPLAVATLRTNPDDVAAAGIMPADDARDAAQSLHDEAAFEATKIELIGMLQGRGFQLTRLLRALLAKWGARSPEIIRRNPYVLLMAKFPSAGWKRCDRLYLDLGHRADRLKRQALCAAFYLRNESGGDTWLSADRVCQAIEQSVSGPNLDPVRALALAIRARKLDRHRDAQGNLWLAEYGKAANETRVAECLQELMSWTGDQQSTQDSNATLTPPHSQDAGETSASPLTSSPTG